MRAGIFLFCLALIAVTACKKIDKLTQFSMAYEESVVIPSATGINLPFNIITPDIATNSESTFELNDTRTDLIEQIKLTTLNLTLTAPSGADFSFLKSIHISVSAEGLAETTVAWKDNVPDDAGSVLILDVSDADLQEYLKKDKFTLTLNTVTDELLTSDHQIDLYAVFFVDAKILGQ